MRVLVNLAFTLLAIFISNAQADIVKPALVEISVYADSTYKIEVRTSIEALLTDIDNRYKDTTQAPKAKEYDVLRELPANELAKAFKPFESEFSEKIELHIDGLQTQPIIEEVSIPVPGYTKVPRTSLITLSGQIDRSAKSLQWYYPASFGDNAIRVRQIDEANEKWHWSSWQWIRDDSISEPFSLTEIFHQKSQWQVFIEYLDAGFDHIFPSGYDHILFIIGLFLLSTQMRPLLWQVTMFTLAHSITLGMSIYGLIQLPASVVEPLIALSISYIAIENIWHKTLHTSRLGIVFMFGLLHGLGFAGFLSEFGMPDHSFFSALLGFNIGVELAQLSLLVLAFLTVGLWFRNKTWYRSVITVPASVIIALIGLYWTWERISW